MADQTHIQRLRGNTAQNNNYTGMDGELTINTDSKSLRIHDGSTLGGHGTVYAASSDTEVYAAMEDLAEKALIIVGTEPPYKLMQKVNGHLVERKLTANGDVYTAHSISEDETEELVQLMPDGGIIIERIGDANPVLKQIVGGELSATELHGKQATYTENADETASIIDELEEGALIVEGTGPLNITASVELSEEEENTLEAKDDGLYGHRSTYYTADENETNAVAANAPDGSLFVEGEGSIAVEVDAKVSAEANNAIVKKTDGVFVDDANFVHKTGNETIEGLKTFSSAVTVQTSRAGVQLRDTNYDRTESRVGSGSNYITRNLYLLDKNGASFASLTYVHDVADVRRINLITHADVEGVSKESVISALVRADGTTYATAATPPATARGGELATAEWVRSFMDSQLNVDITGYNTDIITVSEHFRFSKYGKLVVVDFGGIVPKTSGMNKVICANGASNLPVMRSRPISSLVYDKVPSNDFPHLLVYGTLGQNMLAIHVNAQSVNQNGFYGQLMYFTD